MALVNPNIAMGFRQPEFQVPNALAQYAQIQQIQSGQQAQELNALKMQEYQRSREEEEGTRNFLRGRDLSSPDTLTGLTQFGKTGLGIAKSLQEQNVAALNAKNVQSQISERDFGVQDKKLKFAWNAVGSASTPQAAISELTKGVKDGVFDMKSATTEIQQLQNMSPQDYQQYRVQKVMGILDAKDKLGFMLPKTRDRDIGGSIQTIQDNPALPGYGMLVVGGVVPKTPTFADITSQGQLGVSQGQLAVSQGQLKVAQDRLTKEGANLDPAENAAISKAIIEGRLDPNRVNGRNARILATTLMSNPEANLLELGVSASGATAAERSLATQTAKMSTAANEASKMVDIVRTYSDKVDRTEFPTINAITNAVSKGTGGKEIVQLNTSINALVNSYARAISPTGQPTVSDKNHAREVINSAYSTGQIGAILDVMQQEMSIAREAAGTASTELKAARETARKRGAETQTPKNPHANKTDAQIKKELGLPP
jgi:hypothetical protein